MAQCGTCVSRLYKSVIEEVIAGVKENFLDEGIDDQVLSDLKQQWEAKLAATKAAEHSEITQQHQQNQQQQNSSNPQPPTSQQQQQQQQQTQPTVPGMALVPIQITIPSQQAGGVGKTITIHAPSQALASGIAGPQLQSILSAPAAAQTFALETSQAAKIIQSQLNLALQRHGVSLPEQLLQYNNPVSSQIDGPSDFSLKPLSSTRSRNSGCDVQSITGNVKITAPSEVLDEILNSHLAKSQLDGASGMGDSSDEISDDDEDDDDDDDEKDEDKKGKDDEEEEDAEDEVWNDDPLNSDDDVSEDDTTDVFETENVVVCQYDKVTRVRNKWKFHLKDGIMHLKSKDYVFTKANGEGEW